MSVSALFPAWALPALIFAVALGITLGAAVQVRASARTAQ